MNQREPQITADEARESIERLENARSIAVGTLRPPKWLNALSALLFGILTMGSSLQSGSGVWTVVLFSSALAFIATYVYWLHESRRLGATARLFPSRFASRMFYVGQGIFFAAVILGSHALHDNGAAWAPYAAAIVNAAVFSYLLHCYPSIEWGTKAATK